MQQVVWDIFFKYPFWGSYIAAYLPFKALAAGLLLFMSYLLWAKALGDKSRRVMSVAIFVSTIIYFGLAYADLATFEYAVLHGKSELLMRASQVFATPHFTSFVAIGAWTSMILTIISVLLILETILVKIGVKGVSPLAKLNNALVMVLGPPVAFVAAIYTAFLFTEATARGILVDPIIIPLHFAYAVVLGSGVAYVLTGIRGLGKLCSYGIAAVLAILVIQLIEFGMGFYREDAMVAWTIVVTGVNPLIEGMNYGAVSSMFWMGTALWIVSLILSIVGVWRSNKPLILASLLLFAIGVSFTEFSRLIAAQFMPNS